MINYNVQRKKWLLVSRGQINDIKIRPITIHLCTEFCIYTHRMNAQDKRMSSREIMQRILSETIKITCFQDPVDRVNENGRNSINLLASRFKDFSGFKASPLY